MLSNEHTLVLDKNWQATSAIPVRKSIKTVANGRARFLCHVTSNLYNLEDWLEQPVDNFRSINSCGRIFRLPELIVLKDFVRSSLTRKTRNGRRVDTVIFSRKNLWKRDGMRCQYCGKRPPSYELSIDHVMPKSRWKIEYGPVSCFENCVLACAHCNKKKANKTPEEAGMRLRRLIKNNNGNLVFEYYHRPKAPEWSPYYALVKITKFPESWDQFLSFKNDELYWNVELESDIPFVA